MRNLGLLLFHLLQGTYRLAQVADVDAVTLNHFGWNILLVSCENLTHVCLKLALINLGASLDFGTFSHGFYHLLHG